MSTSRKKTRCEVIPENAPFEEEQLRSLGDEIPSEDTAGEAPYGQQTEQEISRKRKSSSASVDTEQSNQKNPYEKYGCHRTAVPLLLILSSLFC